MARRRTWAAGLVAAGIVTSTFVAPGVAAALPGATASGAVGSPLSAYPAASFDNDALYDEYIRRVLYGDPGIQLFGTSAYDRMGEDGRRFYDVIAQAAREIASGERSRTDGVALPTMTWTYDELGAEPGGEVDAAFAAYRSIIVDEDVVSGLLDDNPYDFFWYDKSGSANGGSAFAYQMRASRNGSSVTVSATASLAVASAYRADPPTPMPSTLRASRRPRAPRRTRGRSSSATRASMTTTSSRRTRTRSATSPPTITTPRPTPPRPTATPGSSSTSSTATMAPAWSARDTPRPSSISATSRPSNRMSSAARPSGAR